MPKQRERGLTKRTDEQTFGEVVQLIQGAQDKALRSVNTTLIELYWAVGEIISRKIAAAEWGDGVVPELAAYIARTQPGLRGFTRANLFRMRQFYEAYREDEKVAPLVRQIPWSHHLLILSQSKQPEEREFYLQMVAREGWSKRELERQLDAALFARVVLSPPIVSPVVRQMHPEAVSLFRDTYNLEFLGLPAVHAEADLHRALLDRLRDFLIELGRDFCFVGSEYPLQVGGQDFALDLLFFHRGLNCLVSIELKINAFRPEYLGKLEFYLEALDRTVKKSHEAALARGVALRQQERRSCRVCAKPKLVAGAGRRVPDPTPGQEATAGETAGVLPAERSDRRPRLRLDQRSEVFENFGFIGGLL